MTTIDVLQQAKQLIEDPKHWCQGYFAKTADGHNADPQGPRACAWCMLGAIKYVTNNPQLESWAVSCLAGGLIQLGYPPDIVSANDGGTHQQVMDAFAQAIEYSKTTHYANDNIT